MFERLRKHRPIIKDINEPGGRPDPRFKGFKLDIPVKEVVNTRNNMDLLWLYSKGPLKDENFGRVCGTCINFYPDPNLGKKIGGPRRGRCKARGFLKVHEELPADTKFNWTDPDSGAYFPEWPECPLYSPRNRLSRK